jgi:hypothetical protein
MRVEYEEILAGLRKELAEKDAEIARLKFPAISYVTVRDAVDRDGGDELHIECRFVNGEKSAPIVIDAGYDELADLHREGALSMTPPLGGKREYQIDILDTATREMRTLVEVWYESLTDPSGLVYWWEDGNGSCDCNRKLSFRRHHVDEQSEDVECSGAANRYLVRLRVGGNVVMDEIGVTYDT